MVLFCDCHFYVSAMVIDHKAQILYIGIQDIGKIITNHAYEMPVTILFMKKNMGLEGWLSHYITYYASMRT